MACLSALPSNSPAFSMRDPTFRETLRRLVGIERQQDEGGFCSCGKQQSGEHARSCSRTGEQNFRHSCQLRRLAQRVKVGLGIPVAVESVECFSAQALAAHKERVRARNGREPQMDAVISPGAMSMPKQRDRNGRVVESPNAAQCHLKGAAIDVSIVDPTCWSSCKESAKAAGSASAQCVEDKLKHYR